MENHPERRDSRRVIVGPEHMIHFVAKGHVFRNIRITNLSKGGCFAVVGQGDAGLFEQGTILEQMGFEHPHLAGGVLTAEVRYVLGGSGSDSAFDFLGLGIQFLTTQPEIRKKLDDFVGSSSNLPSA
jgi:hypothetical protein